MTESTHDSQGPVTCFFDLDNAFDLLYLDGLTSRRDRWRSDAHSWSL